MKGPALRKEDRLTFLRKVVVPAISGFDIRKFIRTGYHEFPEERQISCDGKFRAHLDELQGDDRDYPAREFNVYRLNEFCAHQELLAELARNGHDAVDVQFAYLASLALESLAGGEAVFNATGQYNLFYCQVGPEVLPVSCNTGVRAGGKRWAKFLLPGPMREPGINDQVFVPVQQAGGVNWTLSPEALDILSMVRCKHITYDELATGMRIGWGALEAELRGLTARGLVRVSGEWGETLGRRRLCEPYEPVRRRRVSITPLGKKTVEAEESQKYRELRADREREG